MRSRPGSLVAACHAPPTKLRISRVRIAGEERVAMGLSMYRDRGADATRNLLCARRIQFCHRSTAICTGCRRRCLSQAAATSAEWDSLVVYDGLPHAFWYDPKLPEAIEANHMMADCFVK